jgi:hypothetical protein
MRARSTTVEIDDSLGRLLAATAVGRTTVDVAVTCGFQDEDRLRRDIEALDGDIQRIIVVEGVASIAARLFADRVRELCRSASASFSIGLAAPSIGAAFLSSQPRRIS